ncbi:hypothetical protein ACGFIW_05260 [Micromonospora sp. NPDC048935]|uniref:hypothetical protein n=1 Tax=Micromonospora sp. NPDC048935 TaxID=3364262 RepID=UPI003721F4E6
MKSTISSRRADRPRGATACWAGSEFGGGDDEPQHLLGAHQRGPEVCHDPLLPVGEGLALDRLDVLLVDPDDMPDDGCGVRDRPDDVDSQHDPYGVPQRLLDRDDQLGLVRTVLVPAPQPRLPGLHRPVDRPGVERVDGGPHVQRLDRSGSRW